MRLGKHTPMYYIGNALMALSFFILVFIYYPLAQIYLFPSKPNIPAGHPSISIPKIGAVAPLELNIDPWKKEVYEPALEKGVAHAFGTALPGEGKLIYLFAHSSSPAWKITRYNTIFLRLNELKPGDTVTLNNEGKDYIYNVVDKKVVSPRDIEFLTKPSEKEQLVIQTCWPIGTDWQRLLVFAEPVIN
jgi:sortase A